MSADSAILSPLLQFVLRQSGLETAAYQSKALNRRLAACMRALRASSEQEAIGALRRQPELVELSLSALLIGVSEFFRDKSVFEHLRRAVLPRMLDANRAARVYSAGCSAGQELFSVAILLDELNGLEGTRLLGVDCRPDGIEQASSGAFAVSDLKNVELIRRQHYFHIEGRHAFISPRLRQRTHWRVADFAKFRETEPWDLILFRNVAIYLQADYAKAVWQGLDEQLKPGGVVVTGTAERPPGDLPWKRESLCVYRKLDAKP